MEEEIPSKTKLGVEESSTSKNKCTIEFAMEQIKCNLK